MKSKKICITILLAITCMTLFLTASCSKVQHEKKESSESSSEVVLGPNETPIVPWE